ncbi:glycosyltransferase [Coleofasciculus sp. E2-BRE-01]|uniref:glycosyltransferase n=1 Tax=Coleofasciculus sp. E2-BRE-01 TaxID=3069524 RepID=UPI0032F2684D
MSLLHNGNNQLLLFDLDVTGHHPGYIQHLVKYWCIYEIQGNLNVVVSARFIGLHADVVNVASEFGSTNVNFVPISLEEEASLKPKDSPLNRAYRAFQEWNLLGKYTGLLKPNHCLLMYYDGLQFPLSWRANFPCSLSGIYFRPVFHYSDFPEFIPSWRERFWQWRDKFILSRTLRNANFNTLFCLDPFVVDYIDIFSQQVRAVPLPDPVQIYNYPDSQLEKLREQLEIQPNRITFLMFGAFRKRKGIEQLLDAVALLPSHICHQFCLLFVGSVAAEPLVYKRLDEIAQSLPVQVVKHEQFVSDQEIQPYFQIADVILAPYQRHIGMSAILVRAAAAQKPVLSSNYGVMGEIVKRYRLGLTVDSTSPMEIAKGITQFLSEEPSQFCNFSSMRDFAEQNSAEKFATTVFQHI